jgi:hypothetical protein
VLIECLTDNRNRAAGEVRVAMTRNGGNMADPGSVSHLFSRKGVVTLEKNGLTEDDVLTAVLEAGAEDVDDLERHFRNHLRAGRSGRGANRPAGRRHRLRSRPRPASSPRCPCPSTSTVPARCSS